MSALSRSFSASDQETFAALSGDRNPLHMDPLVARRTPFGRPVVHGLHLVMWALDLFYKDRPGSSRPAALKVDFAQPCLVGDEVRVAFVDDRADSPRLFVFAGSAMLVQIDLLTHRPELPGKTGAGIADLNLKTEGPRDLVFDDLKDDQGRFPFSGSGIAAAFPAVARVLGAPGAIGLVALSTVVGMYCPGRYSLFSSFTAICVDDNGDASVGFSVTRAYASVRQAVIRVQAHGIDASIRAGMRPRPVAQITYGETRALVAPDVFKASRPLIIGGSRGLGEVTAKIIAAGGGYPTITYASGKHDAERVSDEIRSQGGRCDVRHYDVHEAPESQIAPERHLFSTMYYFATTPIFRANQNFHNIALLYEFMTVYVDGFAALCIALAKSSSEGISVFYPSSVALNAPVKGLFEYTAAKSAGEVACSHLVVSIPTLRIVTKRIPRILTDQTATIMPVEAEDPYKIMLPFIHEVEKNRCD